MRSLLDNDNDKECRIQSFRVQGLGHFAQTRNPELRGKPAHENDNNDESELPVVNLLVSV